MKYFIMAPLVAVLFLLPLPGQAQAVQGGSVVEMNSGGKPIAGVAVTVVGAIPTDTDNNGRFRLVFSNAKPGVRVIVGRIHKAGYEIVNDAEVKSWLLSEKVQFKIVMCRTGQLEESRRNFYEIGRDRYYVLYNDALKRLKAGKEANRLNEQQLADSLEAARTMYEDNMRRLDYYADKFSRINKDELGEMDARALGLMEQGLVEDAIAVYEEAKILNAFRDRTARADSLSSDIAILTNTLATQAKLLISKADHASYVKADSILKVMCAYNQNEPRIALTVAELQMSMGMYKEAYNLLSATLPACHDTVVGEMLTDALICAAKYLEHSLPEREWLIQAQTMISEWRSFRSLRTIDKPNR